VPLDEETEADVNPNDWTTQLVSISIKNPRYNKISKERLMNMLCGPNDENKLELLDMLERKSPNKPGDTGQAFNIEKLMGKNEMVPFAAAIFLEPDARSGQLQLKKEIELLDEGASVS
ncbi:MAG: hypothetical protein KDD02_26160, partial [Phaeodactylibacter sp.]|nr:hypothetical protein [Phaeodactylibacter sp.]